MGKEANKRPTAGTGTPVKPEVEGTEILNLANRKAAAHGKIKTGKSCNQEADNPSISCAYESLKN